MGFTKLDGRILQSSIMAEDSDTFKVWIILLASCKEDGISEVSSVFISSISRLSIETVNKSLEKLSLPDENSRSLNDDGRRIRRVDGGFEIINYLKYRDFSLKSAEAERKRLYRSKNYSKCPDTMGHCPDTSASSSSSSSSEFKEEEVQEKGEHQSKTIPPKLDWVRDYCNERKNGINPQEFMDHYETRGWVPKGATKIMKDWQAAVRTWEKWNKKNGVSTPAKKETIIPEWKKTLIEADRQIELEKAEEREQFEKAKQVQRDGTGMQDIKKILSEIIPQEEK